MTAVDPPNRAQRWSDHAGGRVERPVSGSTGSWLSRLRAAIDQETATLTQFSPVDLLLDRIEQCNQQVPRNVELKRPDRAYIEWLKGDKVLGLLSKHSRFPYLQESLSYRALACRKQHEAQRPLFEQIESMMEKDERQFGDSAPGLPEDRLTRNNGPDGENTVTSRPQSIATGSNSSSRGVNGATPTPDIDPLVSRFARLRSNLAPSQQLPYPIGDDAMRLPSGNSSPVRTVPNARPFSQELPSQRPQGPRQMPAAPNNGPPHPPKELPHPLVAAQFPRAPSPVYSPARNIAAPSSVPPPRMTVRSASSTNVRAVQPNPPQLVKYNGYQGQTVPSRPPTVPEVSRPRLPRTTTITPEELFKVFKDGYNVLVVDVRPRELFDEGHIHARSIVCIDPLGLKRGTSYEALLESLVLSPDSERELLKRISEFELVVYYDETTSTDQFLHQPPGSAQPAQLRSLFDTLVVFNEYQPLRINPKILLGGLDAWMEFVGPQALQTSSTMDVPASRKLPTPSRPTRKVSVANYNSSLEKDRRRREYMSHLTPGEKKEFMKLNQDEKIPEQSINDVADAGSGPDEISAETIRTYDDFFRRFPSIKQQSMTNARPINQISSPQTPPLQMIVSSRPSSVPALPAPPPPTAPRPSYGGVSDRGAMQDALARPLGAPPPLYVSRIVASAYKLPRTGLKNFSSTCYMNATIQCMMGTTPLLAFFLNDGYKASVQRNPDGSEGILPEVFANLLRGLWRNVDTCVRPITLQRLGGRLRRDLFQDPTVQQDAKEYLDFLIGTLHDDLNINFQRSKLRTLTTEEENRREAMPTWQASKIEWDRWQHNNQSPISHFFQGQHLSQLICLTCKQTSTKYEPFNSLEIPIPTSGKGVDLESCLREYTKEELLDPGEEWQCPRCKTLRQATKRIIITRLPQILTIHLKRFVNPDMYGNSRKVHTNITFPLQQLDMSPHVQNCLPPVPAASQQQQQPPAPDLAVTPPFWYDAYAILQHHGRELTAGHYTALVRDKIKNVWVNFNDDQVSDLDPSRALPQLKDSYILFYERSKRNH